MLQVSELKGRNGSIAIASNTNSRSCSSICGSAPCSIKSHHICKSFKLEIFIRTTFQKPSAFSEGTPILAISVATSETLNPCKYFAVKGIKSASSNFVGAAPNLSKSNSEIISSIEALNSTGSDDPSLAKWLRSAIGCTPASLISLKASEPNRLDSPSPFGPISRE